MRTGIRHYLTILASLACFNCAIAAPLQQKHVPAEPSFVLHLDVDKIRPTAVGQYLLSELEKPDAASKFAAFQAIYNFDPRRQLHGLTVYNKTMADEDGVVVIYADVDAARLVTLAKAAKDYQSTPYKQYQIHNWIDDKKKAKDGIKPRTYAAIFGSQAVVFGQKEAAVAQALDTLGGGTASLASTTLWPFGSDASSGFLQAVARKLSLSDSDPNAAIFKLSKLLKLQLGEDKGRVNGNLTMVTENESVAANVSGIAKGLVSLMKLQTSKPQNVKLAEGLALDQQGESVVLSLSMLSTDVVELLKAGAARKDAEKSK